jgi:hypothetical protein
MKFKDWFNRNSEDEAPAKKYGNVKEGKTAADWFSGDNDDDDAEAEERRAEQEYQMQEKERMRLEKEKRMAGKDKKQEKVFQVGDVLVLTNKKPSSKMPADAWDFLNTYKTFTVQSVNDHGKINLGCRISKNEDGKGVEKIFNFGTDRFDYADASKRVAPGIKPMVDDIEEDVD